MKPIGFNGFFPQSVAKQKTEKMSQPVASRITRLTRKIESLTTPISAVTAYDYPMGRLADEAGIQVILVGDSLGMMVGGMADTTGVTLDQMIYHTEIVRRGVKDAILISDLPINTYRTPEESVENGLRLIEKGADAIKLEGGLGQVDKIDAMLASDIPVIGHLGMLPQRVREEGGYRKKGKTEKEAEVLIESAVALEESGVHMIVLESIKADTAKSVTESVRIPTIGIGSGTDCTGQIRVIHDIIGGYPWFVPPFAKVYTNVAEQISDALKQYKKELK